MMKHIHNVETGEEYDIEFTEEEIASLDALQNESARITAKEKRDMLLKDSDWRVLPHSPSDVEAWAVYRQQLRDLPSDPAWPYVEFPDPPEAN